MRNHKENSFQNNSQSNSGDESNSESTEEGYRLSERDLQKVQNLIDYLEEEIKDPTLKYQKAEKTEKNSPKNAKKLSSNTSENQSEGSPVSVNKDILFFIEVQQFLTMTNQQRY